jgi:hypothetical protein
MLAILLLSYIRVIAFINEHILHINLEKSFIRAREGGLSIGFVQCANARSEQ